FSARRKRWAWANASISGVTVRVVPATKRIRSLVSCTDSTSVLPHHPRPTMAARIMARGPSLFERVGVPARSLRAASGHPQEREFRVGGERLGDGESELLLDEVDPLDECHHLVERVPPA